MTQNELIDKFPDHCSIKDRVLLISPDMLQSMPGLSVHDGRIFILLTAGSIALKIGSDLAEIQAPAFVDMLIWDPLEFRTISADAQGWCLLPSFLFTNEALHGFKPADAEPFRSLHELPVTKLTPEEADCLQKHLMLLHGALQNQKHLYRTELCQSYFRTFMLEAGNIISQQESASSEPGTVVSRHDTIIRSFLKLVWTNYKKEHNVTFYADKLCLSTKHLSRVVRRGIGKTPYAVIRDELLIRASSLLKDSKKSVQDISAELHFSEMAAFCKFFKKHTGQSPTAFRAANSLTRKN